jgi:hypothetical protein
MTEITPMDYEATIDHFYVFDNVAVFTVKTALDFFPKFITKISNSGYEVKSNHKIIFAAVSSQNLITSHIFDDLELFGVAIFNMNSTAIEYFKADQNVPVVKSRLLDVLTGAINGNIYLNLLATNPNFDVDVNFFIKYGFAYPELIDKTIRLKYVKKPSTKTTLMQIRSIIASLKSNVLLFNMFIPKVVAVTLSKCLQEINEASGNLTIVKYIDDGVALIGLNSDNIQSGEPGQVQLPIKYSPLVFHTHPDHITREFKAFISWPSGQDMVVAASSFLYFRNQLVHFVVSPEGLWSIHVNIEFQKLLISLRSKNASECTQAMFKAIFIVFTNFENPRSSQVIEAIDRYNTSALYLSTIKNYKLSDLFTDVPQLHHVCKANITNDTQLFDISLIKWKRFSESSEEGVYLTFDYVSDIKGGFLPFFFPYS